MVDDLNPDGIHPAFPLGEWFFRQREEIYSWPRVGHNLSGGSVFKWALSGKTSSSKGSGRLGMLGELKSIVYAESVRMPLVCFIKRPLHLDTVRRCTL